MRTRRHEETLKRGDLGACVLERTQAQFAPKLLTGQGISSPQVFKM